MKRPRVRAALALAALALLAALVLASGLIPIDARSGHWAITEWLLTFAKDRSVATHALGDDAPVPLDDPALVLRGAGHYESGCRPCHGVPGRPLPRVARAMLPPPTDLTAFARDEPPAQLFRVIHDGIKFTGMPAWPAEGRADEVWAVVAFVRTLPTLSPDDYWRQVRGERNADPAVPPIVADVCARCHGLDGQGRRAGAFPKLAGQHEAYLTAALVAYADGARPSGMMAPIAVALRDDDLAAAARYYAALDGLGPAAEASPAGAAIVHDGVPAARIPPCHDCHGPTTHARSDAYPLLAGQDRRYLRAQLVLFRERRRGGSPYAELMQAVRAHGLDDAQIEAVSAWYGARE